MSFNTIRFMSIMSFNTNLYSTPKLKSLYDDLSNSFAHTLDRSGKGDREDGNQRRRQITHSFRRFVKTTISDLGYADFSEWFIGHSGSTYWTKKDSEKAEMFRKIEPYLTRQGADIQTKVGTGCVERQGADIQTKVDELEHLNQAMRDRDKMKDLRSYAPYCFIRIGYMLHLPFQHLLNLFKLM